MAYTKGHIIDFLEAVRKRPQMYIGELNAKLMEYFINGFNVGCFASNIDERINFNHSISKSKVLIERGWGAGVFSPLKDMTVRGIPDEAIIDELLAIEIDTWRRIINKP